MRTSRKDVVIPADARWVVLSDDLLGSAELDEWVDLSERFDPEPHRAGMEMAEWLRNGIEQGAMPSATYVLRTDDRLLGFFAVNEVQVAISHRARPIFELHKQFPRKELEAGLMLTHIARARGTQPGLGHMLFRYAVGVALSTPHIVALIVRPHGDDALSQMWQHDYHFREMNNPQEPGLLYFPVGPPPEASWPS